MVTVMAKPRDPFLPPPKPGQPDPDFVDQVFELLVEMIPGLADAPKDLEEAKTAVRAEFRGMAYVAGRNPSAQELRRRQLATEILSNFNGRNATEIARRLQISRCHVYRILKQAGKPKQ
jgi:Mor family transcriptional regulator